MCKHCKPKEATPAAEAGTPEYAVYAALKNIVDRRLLSPLDDANDEAMEALAAYEESRTRNPEPEFRYYSSRHSDYVWRMPATGLGQVRFGPNQPWEESMYTRQEIASIPGHPEIPNPDHEP